MVSRFQRHGNSSSDLKSSYDYRLLLLCELRFETAVDSTGQGRRNFDKIRRSFSIFLHLSPFLHTRSRIVLATGAKMYYLVRENIKSVDK